MNCTYINQALLRGFSSFVSLFRRSSSDSPTHEPLLVPNTTRNMSTTTACCPSQAVEAFITSVRAIASEDNYKDITTIFNEIPTLKEQIATTETQLEDLQTEITKLKTTHEDTLESNLELYRTTHNKLIDEKTALSQTAAALEAIIESKDATLAQLNSTKEELQAQLEQAKSSLNDEQQKVIAADSEIVALQQSLDAKNTEIHELKEKLSKQEDHVARTECILEGIQKDNASLEQKFRTSVARVAELEGFSVELNDDDEDTL
jgi:chromosome segregation ATPase